MVDKPQPARHPLKVDGQKTIFRHKSGFECDQQKWSPYPSDENKKPKEAEGCLIKLLQERKSV